MSKRTTIKDIAKILKISSSTVSRALCDSYDVNPETREKVLKLAKKLNYKRDFGAAGLAGGKTHNIGIILPHITVHYFSMIITGIQEIALAQGYKIILYVTNDSPQLEKDVLSDLNVQNLDGLLVCVCTGSESRSYFEQIIEQGTPIVFFGRILDNILASSVQQDSYNGAFKAVEYLIQQGYKKIAHIGGPSHHLFTQKRLLGYTDALIKHGMELNPEWIIQSGFSQNNGEQDMETLWSLEKKPDAVFAVSDRKAVGAILALKRNNVQIGKNFGVIGFTNDPMSTIISPTLSTIAEPAFEIGKQSCELLLRHIANKNKIQTREIVLSGELIVRESTNRDN
ncbi:LacI family DNA-binding transcriptional regulator [Echinicola shivajiensis]|uniref:LacI family DNA-binding transcriptional regulator n=1 Tax=Echinicola shivajiensis TaxID=1035916 RepID=UPI001BFC64EF|nr:LacI family DNA-binding transcriptional regulator [Echinicola shivajiensis]